MATEDIANLRREYSDRGLTEGDLAADPITMFAGWFDEVLDVDPAVAQGGTLLVGLGDLRLERDDTFEAVVDLGHATPS